MTEFNKSAGDHNQDEDSRIRKVYDHMEIVEKSRQALLSRRRFSVRHQIYIAYALVFLFALGVAAALITNIYQIKSQLQFLEFVNEFASEIQQARRYEKNFFLYGTNLDDALENIHLAKTIFVQNADQFAAILGQKQQQTFLARISAYEDLLDRLKQIQGRKPQLFKNTKLLSKIEDDLRKYGKEMIDSAQGLIKKEKDSLSRTLDRSRDIHIVSLVVLLIFLAVHAYLLVARIYSTLKRFSGYAQRIAAGDITPIIPKRRFRDEFTELAIAINEMIKEMDAREAALIQSHKMRAVGTLTAGVAHELNNPLNNIMLTIHMLMEDYKELSEQERFEMMNDIANETGRAKNIIANLLDFARESATTIETFDLRKLLEDTISLVRKQVSLSGIRIELQVAENLPSIHGDRQKLQQVFLNLILNAVDASEKGGKVQVMALPADKPNHVAIKIIDYGKGIPKHILSSIFDPFFTTKPKGKGTGLGLSVSQGIVAKHGGQIEVTSEEGSGSTFTVVLPVTTFPKEIPLI